ncbi:MAG TPA: exodeoxyribonuclease III [Candidatus Ventrousia excrementavium]|uniref:Exodeoxyribonuclease III n=1 Tax=Candidatus Ventrousia excrementavium TaxID=2840961 RepID=A0A9D1LMK8_9CLOT|nr:exodeoxyribonuclease III [Candidatus Ventrousia excrementavium]
MKLISWNVNGLRACIQKGFYEFLENAAPDCICLQETKMQPGQADVQTPGYHQYWNSAERKGYSGTAIFTRHEPLSVVFEMDDARHVGEGRVITAEYPDFYLVTAYSPNAQEGLARLPYRMEWEDAFRAWLTALDAKKPVVVCGDLNVAHQEVDLKNPKPNRGNAGFSDEERAKMTELLAAGFTDTFRFLHPDATGAYSWWSYRYNARKNNAGWRIDYFLVSDRLRGHVKTAAILNDVYGSDHCPVLLELEL